MKRSASVMSVLGIASLIILVSSGYGLCWQPVVPHSGPPLGVPMTPFPPPAGGPMPMPFNFGPFGPPPCGPPPCGPPPCGKALTVEGGARGIYSTNGISLRIDRHGSIDFVRDLNFSQSTLLGEVYAAARVSPTLAFTYTFMIPREDNGHGVLPAPIIVGHTQFPAGDRVSLRYELTVHRFEGELYPVVSNNYRVGGWLLGEILVQNLRVRDVQTQSDSVSTSDFIMGVGGVAEISPGTNMFARLKGAYTFLQNQTGVYLEGEGKFFPQFDGGFRPYLGAGYRYRFMQWTLAEGNMKWNVYAHGPFAEFGIIF